MGKPLRFDHLSEQLSIASQKLAILLGQCCFILDILHFSFLLKELMLTELMAQSSLPMLQVAHQKINFRYLDLSWIQVSFFFSSDLSQLFQFIFNIQKQIISLSLSFIDHLQFQLLRGLLATDYLFIPLLLVILGPFYLNPKQIG